MEEIDYGYPCFAILFQKYAVGEGRFVFRPTGMLEGTYDEEDMLFIDELLREYDSMLSSDIAWSTDPDVVGCIITKEDLEKTYPNKSLDEAKSNYLEEMSSKLFYGTIDQDQQKILLLCFSCDELDAALGSTLYSLTQPSKNIGQNHNSSKTSETSVTLDDYSGATKLVMDPDIIGNIIATEDPEMVKEMLKKVLRDHNEMVKAFQEINRDNIYGNDFDSADEAPEYPEDEITVEEELSIDMTNPYAVFGFDFNKVEKELNNRIIAQPDAIEAVLSAISTDGFAERTMDKTRMILYGPSGVGKTEVFKSISEILDKPMVIIDCEQLSPTGFVGSDLTDVIKRLVAKAGGDVEKAKHGIVLFDELDKKARVASGGNGGEFFQSVLDAILKFTEATDYEVHDNKYRSSGSYYFNTGDLTVAVSGTFAHAIEQKKKDKKSPIGFGSQVDITHKDDSLTPLLDDDDFIKYAGLSPEFLGRFGVKVPFNNLTKDDLIEILLKSPINALQGIKKILANMGVDLIWDNDFIEELAERASKKKTGARSFKGILETVYLKAKAECQRSLGMYTSIKLTKDSIDDFRKVVLVDLNGVEIELGEILDSKKIKFDIETPGRVKTIGRMPGSG